MFVLDCPFIEEGCRLYDSTDSTPRPIGVGKTARDSLKESKGKKGNQIRIIKMS